MYYKELQVDGTINVTELDEGLVSLTEEPKTIRAVLINLSAHEGNVLEGWIGTERVLAIYDYCLDTQEETAVATAPLSQNKINRIPVGLPIPPGQTFKIGIRCGAVANDVYGAYEYDITT